MHKATIASKVGGVPVLIDDGVNGLIFEPGDEKQLAQHLLTSLKTESCGRPLESASTKRPAGSSPLTGWWSTSLRSMRAS